MLSYLNGAGKPKITLPGTNKIIIMYFYAFVYIHAVTSDP